MLLGQPKIQNLDLPPVASHLVHKQICRLDIAVNDALAVRRSQRGCRLLAEGNHLVGTQWPSCLGQILLQRLAVQQLHDQIRPPILLAGVEDGADVGMAQRRGGARFAQETLMGEVRAGVRGGAPGGWAAFRIYSEKAL